MMNMTEHRKLAHTAAVEAIDKLCLVEAVTLSRVAELSRDINFADSVEPVDDMLQLFRLLKERDLSRLPTDQLRNIKSAADILQAHVDQIRNFTLHSDSPGPTCKSIIVNSTAIYDSVLEPVALPLAFTAIQGTDYNRIEREALGFRSKMGEQYESMQSEMTKGRNEALLAVTAIKEQAADLGVTSNAQIFIQCAEMHKTASQWWIKATTIMAAVTLIAAITSVGMAIGYVPATVAGSVQLVVSKLIVLSTLSLFSVWCASNYRSEKHNETLNVHRANALKTFKTFVEGGNDPRIKDAILMHAAQSVFSSRSTGFESSEKEPQHINPVVEILGKTIPST